MKRPHRSHNNHKSYDVTLRRGFEQKSGAVVFRTDEVLHRGKLVGKLQYKSTGNKSQIVSISVIGGTKPGEDIKWLINRAKGAFLFVDPIERQEAFDFNKRRLGAPRC